MDTQFYPSPTPVLPVGSREEGIGSRDKGIGNKEEVKKKTATAVDVTEIKTDFLSFKNEVIYKEIDFDNEFLLMCDWYHDNKKQIVNKKTACRNWLTIALKKLADQKSHGSNSSKPNSAGGVSAVDDDGMAGFRTI